MPRDLTLTADFAYVRLHGRSGGYDQHYTRRELAPWVEFLTGLGAAGTDAYVYFNSDAGARAPSDAGELVGMLEARHAGVWRGRGAA